MASLSLPHLRQLLAQLAPGRSDAGDAQSLNAPHERALAQALGWLAPDGRIPFAAPSAGLNAGVASWAFVTPCHWQMGQDHVRMLDPAVLQLSAEHAQQLHQAMRPYFAEDGIDLHGVCLPSHTGQPAALSWLAKGELFRDMACASLDRVSGRDLALWMPQGPGAKIVRRLQSEMQMLLYTHSVNDERQRLGLLPVNSFWVSGCGALPAEGAQSIDPGNFVVDSSLRQAAFADDPAAFSTAWQQLDAGPVVRMQEAVRRGQAVQLTLCGERGSASWSNPPPGLGAKARQWLRGLRGPSVQEVMASL